ncbi:hypothetical protein [Streptomyces sp. NRRL S-118]|uniref:hypothetical protein n=1 Tax=Streptomyces sp. NRRL S-118 TaxID=1463881 RepID=UPI0004C567E6|nr:hypothetical protein [Streptomyces sp. NRRL S-118]
MDLKRLTALATATADDDPLVGPGAVAPPRGETERIEVLVVRARHRDATGPRIAAAMGVPKQAVHKQHGGRGLRGGRS